MAHGGIHHDPADLDPAFAGVVADTMQALAAPSRVRILGRLHAGAARSTTWPRRSAWSPRRSRTSCACCAISASSPGRRDGRRVVYDLYDDHVGELLEQAISHAEHVRAGLARSADRDLAAPA